MARFLIALLAAALVAVQAGGQLGHAAPATAEVFWRTVLPHSPLPDAILRLLRPAADTSSFVSKAEERPPFDYQDYRRSSSGDGSSKRTGAAARAGDFDYDDYRGGGERRVAAADTPFGYDYKAPSTNQAGERLAGAAADTPFGYDYKAPSTAMGGGQAEPTKTKVFFHEESVRVGERLPFHFPPASAPALGFLPRRVADSVPFMAPALPGVLAAFGVAPGSTMASSMEATLRACETPTMAGESKFCATSLEALVERAMGVLGTRDVRPVTSTLPRDGAPLQTYTVRAVQRVEGGPVFVACHPEPFPYTVYRCHTTGPSRAYMVEMEGARGAVDGVTIATVCHTDTSMWNPEHISFRLLGTKPGGTPVCHLMPYGHIIWAKNVKRWTA
ncbi:protein RAFTIN 1B-like [Lolium rigidum]|uniref:protein RAFTIN 1B-like n=1 Tax=Lolium rigidum TaxID=89674 RepID=UPI001F5C18F6|nr:protein RAFTIN 1B-like [Lolium rigidum]XP_047086688.1 protein RAFTIN 1B-like [Lolium rigidum]